jgi:predicted TIM-barrel fold metal-dependent hydrolase
MDARIIHVDGHIMEPAELWRDYIEAEIRDRTVRIEHDEQGLEHLTIDRQRIELMQGGTMGSFGAIGKDARPYLTPGKISWREAMVSGGYDPHERVKVMDAEDIDMTLVYPSLDTCRECGCKDAKLAAASCRAYNDRAFDFCQSHPDRLVPVTHIPTLDLDEGVGEVERTVALGAKALMISDAPPSDLPYGLPHYDRL